MKIARVKSHVLEWIIGGLMTLFGLAALYLFVGSLESPSKDAAIIEILLIIVLAILAQTGILIRIYEQHNDR